MKSKILKFHGLRWPKFLALTFFFLLFGAYTQIFAVFAPGATLDPICAPGASGCRVEDNKWDILSSIIHLNNGHVGISTIDPSVSLDVTGDIEYTGTITDISDERLKDNIVPITNALDKVLGIKGKYYNMKETPGKLETGFIAQNVKDYVPTAVSVVDPVNGYLGVSYPALIPIAFGAIQELNLKVETFNENAVKISSLDSLVKDFLSNATNNLDLVFFGEVRAKKLCLDDLCFTKDELKKILDHVNTLAPVNTGTTTDNTNNNTNSNTDDNTNNTNIGNQNGNANGGEGDTNTNGNQNNTNGNGALDNNDKTGGSETENGNSNNGNNSNNENNGNGNGNSDKKS